MIPNKCSGNPGAGNNANTGNEGGLLNGGEVRRNCPTFDEVILRNRLTALVVDNHDFCRTINEGFLKAYGVKTYCLDNGKAAVDLIASGLNFDLIVMDNNLPVMDGLETTRQIRAMGVTCKIVGVSGAAKERERQAFLAAGIDEFTEKPLSPDKLVPILKELDGQ